MFNFQIRFMRIRPTVLEVPSRSSLKRERRNFPNAKELQEPERTSKTGKNFQNRKELPEPERTSRTAYFRIVTIWLILSIFCMKNTLYNEGRLF